ncbi:MAG: response regulator [Deltaproteobacteria bacterium]|nr:response regulator [Deltaproteobacteria bacterium]
MADNIRVLTIDDEADFCYFVKKNLMHSGLFDVIIATNGKEGIKLAKEEKPDIILLDLFMPDMPGEDVAAALKENDATANIPILYVTALATNDDIGDDEEKNQIGNNYILPKPITTKKLIKMIMKILGEV